MTRLSDPLNPAMHYPKSVLWLSGILGVSLLLGLPFKAQAQSLDTPTESALGTTVRSQVQRRVNRELVVLCGDFRCEGYRRTVRVNMTPSDTLDSAGQRLTSAILGEVEQAFLSQPSLQRVIIDGYLFQGATFTTLEMPPITVSVPRHRWVVDRYGIEQDSILYAELLDEVEAELSPTPSTPSAPSNDLPPLPSLPDVETPAVEPGNVQRQPIDP